MNYEQNLRQKAELLVKEKYPVTYKIATQAVGYQYEDGWSGRYYKKQLEYMIEQMLPIARIALQWCAESYIQAQLPHYGYQDDMIPSAMGRVNREMIQAGLIPDSMQNKPSYPEENWRL